MTGVDLERFEEAIRRAAVPEFRGEVKRVAGGLIEAASLQAAVGEMVRIQGLTGDPIEAEVVGFRDEQTLLMPHGDISGIAPRQKVRALGHSFEVGVGNDLLGRTVDGFGRPLDGAAGALVTARRSVRAEPPPALSRPHVDEALRTGVRAIDGLTTLGRGQRLGVFAGSGVGKSSLMGQILRGTDADVTVLALVGERGREVRGFLDNVLGPEGCKRAVTVCATSDRSPIERYLAPFVAVTVAEHFRDQGKDVLLVMDSVTRFAQACREIGLAAGEPAALRGYPPSFFATVPKLVERMGRSEVGSITGLLTILVDGDDPNEPVSDTLRGLLDGHVHLDRELANAGHFPAIDVLSSLSRLMSELASPRHQALARVMRRDLAVYKESRDLIEVGAYRAGTNPALDVALTRRALVEAFLRQDQNELQDLDETIALLEGIFGAEVPL